ncbi:WD40-repeat-containing domain protein [Blastocladiella britannica]|nr:WD40-repeat-containing domain protein [Blastocladiella britannica]
MAQVQVKFTTTEEQYAVPSSAPILLPTDFKRSALNEVINHLLGKGRENAVNFEFLIDDTLLRTSLASYLTQHNLSAENVLSIQYIVAVPPPKPVASFQADDWISAVGISSAERFVSGGYDGVVRLWNREGETCAKLQLGTAPLKSVALLPPTNPGAEALEGIVRVAAAGMNQKTAIVELSDDGTAKHVCDLTGHTGTIESIVVAPNSEHLYSAAWDASIQVYSVSETSLGTASLPPPTKKPRKGMGSAAAAAASSTQASGPAVPQLSPVGSLTGHVGAVNGVSASERELFSGGNDHSIRQWDLRTHTLMASMSCEKVVRGVSYSARNGLVASAHADPVVRVWDPRSTDATLVKARLLGHRNQVAAVAWAPDAEHHLASASLDGSVRVFDLRSPSQALHIVQQPVALPNATVEEGKKAPIAKRFCVGWSHGMVVSGGEDCTLGVWEAPSTH